MKSIEIKARGFTFSALADGPEDGPYRFEILENVHQPILQAAPEKLTAMLLEHLTEHAGGTN